MNVRMAFSRHSKLLVLLLVLVPLLTPVYGEEQELGVESSPSRKDSFEMAPARFRICKPIKKDPRKILRRLRNLYFFVNAFRVEREEDDYGSEKDVPAGKYCPFKHVEENKGQNQLPQYEIKAVCPNCKDYCKPVYYKIQVLKSAGCDKKMGEEKWLRTEKKVPVAYVYSPNS